MKRQGKTRGHIFQNDNIFYISWELNIIELWQTEPSSQGDCQIHPETQYIEDTQKEKQNLC